MQTASTPDARPILSLADLEAFDKVRTQKKLSLNLQTRIAEREHLEKERLDRENQRRAARGEPPLAKLADLGDADPPDAVLAETAEIAADLSRMQGLYLSRVKAEARTESETATP